MSWYEIKPNFATPEFSQGMEIHSFPVVTLLQPTEQRSIWQWLCCLFFFFFFVCDYDYLRIKVLSENQNKALYVMY